jgi:UDPglucose--hexose-1-phosphate uridylyltransferase
MSTSSAWIQGPHRRRNPLTGEWVLVSPHRTQRPWLGRQEAVAGARRPAHDPACYLCPGSTRANGAKNPAYAGAYVFPNDFAALNADRQAPAGAAHPLMRGEPTRGACRVICFSPRHDLTLPEMPVEAIRGVVDVWADQVADLGRAGAGCRSSRTRARDGLLEPAPARPGVGGRRAAQRAGEGGPRRQRAHLAQYGRRCCWPTTLDLEAREGARIVVENEHWLAVVPYWAIWPFETLLLPRRAVLRLPTCCPTSSATRWPHPEAAADALRQPVPDRPSPTRWAGTARPRQAGDFRPLAAARPLLPAAAALRHGEEVHGRLRDAGRGPARPDARTGRRAAARTSRRPLPEAMR